eukprot:COSAG01_NODE_34991_length_538_cov_77.107062_1_plen_92_part_01
MLRPSGARQLSGAVLSVERGGFVSGNGTRVLRPGAHACPVRWQESAIPTHALARCIAPDWFGDVLCARCRCPALPSLSRRLHPWMMILRPPT